MRFFTHLGDAPVAVGVAALPLLLAWGGQPVGGVGASAALALIVSHLLSQLLKRAICRPRPRLPIALRSVTRAPDRFSFPSGHASATVAVALPLAVSLPPLAAAAALLLPLAVGVSRCYLGVHYPGDVLAGWALGVVCAASVLLLGG